MSLLLAEGHANARLYPIACLWSESRIAREREAARVTREAVVLHTVIAASLGGAEATKELNKLLGKVNDVG